MIATKFCSFGLPGDHPTKYIVTLGYYPAHSRSRATPLTSPQAESYHIGLLTQWLNRRHARRG